VNHKKKRLAGVWSKLIIIIYLTTTASNKFFLEKQKASQPVKKKLVVYTIHIHGVPGGTVNILGGGSGDYSE
jgi:uncharacterized alpha/beta hydrolase family protein